MFENSIQKFRDKYESVNPSLYPAPISKGKTCTVSVLDKPCQYGHAGLLLRMGANFCDLIIAYMFTFLMWVALSIGYDNSNKNVWVEIYLLVYVAIFSFSFFSWQATPGKKLFKIQVLSYSEKRLSLSHSLLVSSIIFIQYLLLSPFAPFFKPYLIILLSLGFIVLLCPYIIAIITKNKLLLQDRMCRTKVVRNNVKWKLFTEKNFGLEQMPNGQWCWEPIGINGLLEVWFRKLFHKSNQKFIVSKELKEKIYNFYCLMYGIVIPFAPLGFGLVKHNFINSYIAFALIGLLVLGHYLYFKSGINKFIIIAKLEGLR